MKNLVKKKFLKFHPELILNQAKFDGSCLGSQEVVVVNGQLEAVVLEVYRLTIVIMIKIF
jgi:hypothetical protein